LDKEAWCWYHLTSEEFYLGAVVACETVRDFFKRETLSRNAADFGRNNQIYDSWARHARELTQAIGFVEYGDYAPLRSAAADIRSTNRGINQWGNMGWLGEAEAEYSRLAEIAGEYGSSIEAALECGLVGGLYWLEDAANDPPERRNAPFGYGIYVADFVTVDKYNGKTPEEKYPHLREHPIPEAFPRYAPDTSRPCKTGETVPWTGVWVSEEGIARHPLTFALKGRSMTPSWKIIQTEEENEAVLLKQPGYTKNNDDSIAIPTPEEGGDKWVWPTPQFEITATTWYPLLEATKVEVNLP
jgi:hypothetical protein